MLPIVTIIGKENAGKSTLFNRLLGIRTAITHSTPGTTRDRNAKKIEIGDSQCLLIDTGGYLPHESSALPTLPTGQAGGQAGIKSKVKEQVEIAVSSSKLILFVVDAKTGITSADIDIAEYLRKLNKKVILVVNKVDSNSRASTIAEFYKLGFEPLLQISAIHNIGMSDLIDKINEYIDKTPLSDTPSLPVFTIIGRPNVGKSTYINSILGENRVIVDENPGTTIDTIDVTVNYDDKEFILIDTPGLRKRPKIDTEIEYYSSVRTHSSISRCDVAILLIDANAPLTHQDKHIIDNVLSYGKGLVLAANKIDLGVSFDEYSMRFVKFVPITYISALNNHAIYEPINTALSVANACKQHITRAKLREMALALKLIKIVQLNVSPPKFAIKIPPSKKPKIDFKFRRFIENYLRKEFDFTGTPLVITTYTKKDELADYRKSNL